MGEESKSFLYSKYQTLQPTRSKGAHVNDTGSIYGSTLKRNKNNGIPTSSSIASNVFMQNSIANSQPPKTPKNFDSKIGNGFRTVPNNVFKTSQSFDPLNNVNRFAKRQESIQEETPNNFEFYRNYALRSSEYASFPVKPPIDSDLLVNRFSKSSPTRKSVSFAPAFQNKTSRLLSQEENRVVFDILGKETQVLAASVGRVLLPNISLCKWKIKGSTGILCLVKNSQSNLYYITLMSLQTRGVTFRHEVPRNLEYILPKGNFLIFQRGDSVAALLFADAKEAMTFCKTLENEMDAQRIANNELPQPESMRMTHMKSTSTLRRHVLI